MVKVKVADYCNRGVRRSEPKTKQKTIWLEDPDSEEVNDFVKKQVELTESVLKKCETREKLHDKLTKFYDYPKFGAPFRECG
ncbi:prolyl oligopeptidase family protein [Artemisia annua]|uniref:Prolyl oligopeptidase family protein n=1 Tax=Artemisia annua TaxID=35608 RepID=A0A2U1LY00_ARTAN|nr:prolyl oligopeptidase family protein [Artemisia annua]